MKSSAELLSPPEFGPRGASIMCAGGQYPRTGVARQYGLWVRARRPLWGGRNLRLIVKSTALSRKETRDHRHYRDVLGTPITLELVRGGGALPRISSSL
jgi:hypothetical protein